MERCKVLSFRNKILVEKAEFNDYEKALDYTFKQVSKGCYCILFRQNENKKWSKSYFWPSETM